MVTPINMFLPAPLTGMEWLVLKNLSVNANATDLPPDACRRLVLLGHADPFENGLLITEEGLLRLQNSSDVGL